MSPRAKKNREKIQLLSIVVSGDADNVVLGRAVHLILVVVAAHPVSDPTAAVVPGFTAVMVLRGFAT